MYCAAISLSLTHSGRVTRTLRRFSAPRQGPDLASQRRLSRHNGEPPTDRHRCFPPQTQLYCGQNHPAGRGPMPAATVSAVHDPASTSRRRDRSTHIVVGVTTDWTASTLGGLAERGQHRVTAGPREAGASGARRGRGSPYCHIQAHSRPWARPAAAAGPRVPGSRGFDPIADDDA